MSETRRLKVGGRLKGFIPTTVNFSELDARRVDSPSDDNSRYLNEPYGDDGGMFVETLEESIDYEKMIVQMIYSLDPNEKLIFMFQLFRDMGYQIDHGSFARALKMSRVKYMNILKMVKFKTLLMVQERKRSLMHK